MTKLQAAMSDGTLATAVDRIVSHWAASPEAHDAFRRWAHTLLSELSSTATDAPPLPDRMERLRTDFRHVHAELAKTLVEAGQVDEHLVSRRSFLAHLLDLVEPPAPTKPSVFVRTAA